MEQIDHKIGASIRTSSGISRARTWTFTIWFAFDTFDEAAQRNLDVSSNELLLDVKRNKRIVYTMLGGVERTGTSKYHAHGVVQYTNPVRCSTVIKDLHLKDFPHFFVTPSEVSKGLPYHIAHAIKLDSKVDAEQRFLFEHPADSPLVTTALSKPSWVKFKPGDAPAKPSPTWSKWLDAMEMAKNGMLEPVPGTCNEVDCCVYHKHPKVYLDKRQQLTILQPKQDAPDGCIKQDHLWIWGPTGCGKTSSVWALFQADGLYRRDTAMKFWQSYGNEPNVVIEDVNNSSLRQMTLTTLKNLCDPTGFPIEQKYGPSQVIRPRIIVTSQYTIDECAKYIGKNAKFNSDWYHEEDLAAVKRRFRCINFHQWLFEQNLQVVSVERRKALDQARCSDPMQYLEPFDWECTNAPPAFAQWCRRSADSSDAQDQLGDELNTFVSRKRLADTDGQDWSITFDVDRSKSWPFKDDTGHGVMFIGHHGEKRLKIKQYKPVDHVQHFTVRPSDSPLQDEEDEPAVHPDYVIN